jgi:acyl carrier protein
MGLFSKKSPVKSDLPSASPSQSPAAPASAGSVVDMLRATVSRISRDHIPAAELDLRAHLLDSGYIDSLSATELLAEIERSYGVRLDEMQLVGRLCNLEALAREIEARSGGNAR